jgi:hypothetical protein
MLSIDDGAFGLDAFDRLHLFRQPPARLQRVGPRSDHKSRPRRLADASMSSPRHLAIFIVSASCWSRQVRPLVLQARRLVARTLKPPGDHLTGGTLNMAQLVENRGYELRMRRTWGRIRGIN